MKDETIVNMRRLCELILAPTSLYELNAMRPACRDILAELNPPAFKGTFEITLGADGESGVIDGKPATQTEIWETLMQVGREQAPPPIEPPGYLGIEVTYPGPKYYRMSLRGPTPDNWTAFCHAVLTMLDEHRVERARDLAEEKTA